MGTPGGTHGQPGPPAISATALLLLLSSLLLANLPVQVWAEITDEGQLNAVAALTNTSNGPCINENDWGTPGDPCSGTTSNRRIYCNAERTQIIAVYCYDQPASLSFTVPSEVSGLTYMTLL